MEAYRSGEHAHVRLVEVKGDDRPLSWSKNGFGLDLFSSLAISIGFYRDWKFSDHQNRNLASPKVADGWKFCVDISALLPIAKFICFSFAWAWKMVDVPSYKCLKGVDFVLAEGDPLKMLSFMKHGETFGDKLKALLMQALGTIFKPCNFLKHIAVKFGFKWLFQAKGGGKFPEISLPSGGTVTDRRKCWRDDSYGKKIGEDEAPKPADPKAPYGGERCYKFYTPTKDKSSKWADTYFYQVDDKHPDKGCKCVRNRKWEACMQLQIAQWVGCYLDVAYVYKKNASNVTQDACKAYCEEKRTRYFALKEGTCKCVNTLGATSNHGLLQTSAVGPSSSSDDCPCKEKDMPCEAGGKSLLQRSYRFLAQHMGASTCVPRNETSLKCAQDQKDCFPQFALKTSYAEAECAKQNIYLLTVDGAYHGHENEHGHESEQGNESDHSHGGNSSSADHSADDSNATSLLQVKLSEQVISKSTSKEKLVAIMRARTNEANEELTQGVDYFKSYLETGNMNIPFCAGKKEHCHKDELRSISGNITKENSPGCRGAILKATIPKLTLGSLVYIATSNSETALAVLGPLKGMGISKATLELELTDSLLALRVRGLQCSRTILRTFSANSCSVPPITLFFKRARK